MSMGKLLTALHSRGLADPSALRRAPEGARFLVILQGYNLQLNAAGTQPQWARLKAAACI